MYNSGLGRWQAAEQSFKAAQKIADDMGDKRVSEESAIFLATSYYHRGNIADASRLTETALDSARSRGDIQMQIMALITQARNYHTLGRWQECDTILREMHAAFNSVGYTDASSAMNYHALMSVAHLRSGKFGKAYEDMRETIRLIEKTEPTSYFTTFAQVSVPEMYMTILAASNSDRGDSVLRELKLNKATLMSLHEKSIAQLKLYSDVYPIAAPRHSLWQGVGFYSIAKAKESDASYKRALDEATNLGMNYEVALALYFRGGHERNASAGQQSVQRAKELFAKIGVQLTGQLPEARLFKPK